MVQAQTFHAYALAIGKAPMVRKEEMTTSVGLLEQARLLVSGDKEASLEAIAQAFSAGEANSPLDLFTTDKPSATMRGRAWGAYIIHKYPAIKVSHVVKHQTAIGKKFEELNFTLDTNSMTELLTSLSDQIKAEKEAKEFEAVMNGDKLTADLDALSAIVKEIASNPIYPSRNDEQKYVAVLSQLEALRGSFVRKVEAEQVA